MLRSKPYPIMDPSGKAKVWLDAGRGLAIWPCQALDSAQLGNDQITPADGWMPGASEDAPRPRPSDWRFRAERPELVITSAEEVIFFRKCYCERHWTASPAGWRAAERYADSPEREGVREAPIGTVYSRYSVERLSLESDKKREDGQPLLCLYRIGVIVWTAIVPRAD